MPDSSGSCQIIPSYVYIAQRSAADSRRGSTVDDLEYPSPDTKEDKNFKPRRYVTQACQSCRTRKTKCTGTIPCLDCKSRQESCEYGPVDGRSRRAVSLVEDVGLPSNTEEGKKVEPSMSRRTQACLSCYTRKRKCNNYIPCTNCKTRMESCVERPVNPGPRKP